MEIFLKKQLDLIIFIQQVHGPLWDNFFRAVSFMGDEAFYLLLFPFLLWCVDFGLGLRVGIMFLFSIYINDNIKGIFCQPRPFDFDPHVKLSDAEGYGFPSGHAQSSIVIWGMVAYFVRKTWCWAVALALALIIGFSRIYLGVHFPTDVLGGWLIGIILLATYVILHRRVENKLAGLSMRQNILLAFFICLLLFFISPTKNIGRVAGIIAGLGVGMPIMRKYVDFNACGPWSLRILCLCIGQVITVILYLFFKMILHGKTGGFYLVFYFLEYFLIGLWIVLGGPYLFRLMGIGGK